MADANKVGTEESGSVSGPPCAPRPPTTGVSDTQMDRDVDDMLRLAEEEALAEDGAAAVAALGEQIEKRSGTTPPPSQGLLASWLASSVVPPEVATSTGRSLKKACFPELSQQAKSTNSPPLKPAAPAEARPSTIDEREEAAAQLRAWSRAQAAQQIPASDICGSCKHVLPVPTAPDAANPCPRCTLAATQPEPLVAPVAVQAQPDATVPSTAANEGDAVPLAQVAEQPPVVAGDAPQPVACKAMPPRLQHEVHLYKAQRWRDDVVAVLDARSFLQLPRLAVKAGSLKVSRAILEETGIGFLIADRSLWALCPAVGRVRSAAEVADGVHKTWLALKRGCKLEKAAEDIVSLEDDAGWKPLGNQQAQPFLRTVDALQEFALANDDVRRGVAAKAAFHLAKIGITRWKDLTQLSADVPRIHRWPAPVATTATNMIAAAHRALRREEALKDAASQATSPRKRPRKNLNESAAVAAMCIHQDEAEAGEAVAPAQKMLPRAAIAHAAVSCALEDLSSRAFELRAGTRRHTASVRSALNAWHAFATMVLKVPSEETLPPQSTEHVEAFVALFRSGHTASNYVGAMRWACDVRGLHKSWDSDTLKLTIKGLKIRSTSAAVQRLARMLLLSTALVRRIVAFADAAWPRSWFPALLLVSWALLLRVQSEAVPLEIGELSDLTTLPPQRHSAVAWDPQGKLWIRWRRRKHRPDGCTRSLPCSCAADGAQFCATCRLKAYAEEHGLLSGSQAGTRLWAQATPSSSLAVLRQALGLLQIPGAASFTWKAVRAGRATELSRTPGVSIQEIMMAGDWLSKAVFCYIKESEIDAESVIAAAVEESEDEEA